MRMASVFPNSTASVTATASDATEGRDRSDNDGRRTFLPRKEDVVSRLEANYRTPHSSVDDDAERGREFSSFVKTLTSGQLRVGARMQREKGERRRVRENARTKREY
ncbi:hypothetical protein MRX96_017937 [Rhipicephalus microplus]